MASKTSLKQQCPHCEAVVPIKDESLIGKKIKCPKCGESFRVEDPEEEKPAKGSKAKGPANGKAAAKPGARRQRDEDEGDEDQPRFKKKSQGNSTLLICLGVGGVAVALLGVAAYFVFFNDSKSPKKPDTPAQAARTGPGTTPPGGTISSDNTPKTETPTLTTPTLVAGNPIANMLPNDTQLVLNLAMADILNKPLGQRFLDNPTFTRALGFPVGSIEQVILALKNGEWAFLILRTKTDAPIHMEAVQTAMRLKPAAETPPAGQDYFLTTFSWADLGNAVAPAWSRLLPASGPVALKLFNPNILVLTDVPQMKTWLSLKGQPPMQAVAVAAPTQDAAAPGLPGRGGPPPGGARGRAPVPTPGGGQPAAAPPVVDSGVYRTISPRLKAMLDLMETNKPYLFSFAADFAAFEKAVVVITPDGQSTDAFKVAGASVGWKDKKIAWGGLELNTEQDAAALKQTLDQALPQLDTLAKAVGIKIEKGASSGVQLPGLPGGGAGRPNLPGGGFPIPGGRPPPGGGNRPPPGGGNRPPPGAGQVPPGSPGGQPPNQPPPISIGVTLVYDIRQAGPTVVGTLEVKGDGVDRIIESAVEQAQPYLARLQGEVDMASVRPNPYVLAATARAYAERNQRFPRGTANRPKRASRPWPPDQRVSFMADLLPYLGLDALHQRIKTNESWRDPDNLPVASTLVPQFLSPDLPRQNWFVRYPGLNLDVAASSYVGIAGVGLDAAEYKAGDKKRGVFGYEGDRAIPLSEIDDPANTILLIQTPPLLQGPWLAGGGSTVRGVPETKSVEPFLTQGANGKRGTHMIMVDGSVRWVTDQISDEVFKQLAQVKGRKTTDLDDVAKKVPKPANLPELKAVVKVPTAPPTKEAPKAVEPAGTASRNPQEVAAAKEDLKELGLAYFTFMDRNLEKPPANADELAKYLVPNGRALKGVKEGTYVFLYGVGIKDMKDGTANTVLAHEKDVPTKGGVVLMADGSVKEMTPQEFKAAPKAVKPAAQPK